MDYDLGANTSRGDRQISRSSKVAFLSSHDITSIAAPATGFCETRVNSNYRPCATTLFEDEFHQPVNAFSIVAPPSAAAQQAETSSSP